MIAVSEEGKSIGLLLPFVKNYAYNCDSIAGIWQL